jgi:SPP1 gp7 family putative phage head morphogenesis protein
MVDLVSKVNLKDPSGLRRTEERRAVEVQKDLDAAMKRALDRVTSSGVTDPLVIKSIVDSELSHFDTTARDKVLKWVKDSRARGEIRGAQLLKVGGVELGVRAILGGGGISDDVRKAVEVRVAGSFETLSASSRQKLTQVLVDGMQAGNGPRVIAKAISEDLAIERNRATVIARTETMNGFRDGATAQFQRHGIEEEEWLSTVGDSRTCDECAALNGTRYKVGQRPHVHGGTDISCRCIGLPVIPEVD